MRKTMPHGFDLPSIKASLESSDWETDHEDQERENRAVWLGSTFGLTPSGKFYAPFACSNVVGCASCQGTGIMPVHVGKRRAARAHRPPCTACGGEGSREAYLDSLWADAAEKAIESIGASLWWYDGDAFAAQWRQAEPRDDDEGDAEDFVW